ncbi:MAG: FeoB-associated Cys-rich membrane protein [Ruminococcus sp.]|nr:FeoB-associated Cys-rich membrane protein [Ruminococcus sp.]
MGTFFVAIALIVLISLIVVKLVHDKRAGKSSCGNGCQHCAMHAQCHKAKEK